MKVEMICSKQDLVDALRKASKYSKMEHLNKLAEYVQQEFDLDNLKDGMTIRHYDVVFREGCYCIVLKRSQYSSTENKWTVLEEEVIEKIEGNSLDKIVV